MACLMPTWTWFYNFPVVLHRERRKIYFLSLSKASKGDSREMSKFQIPEFRGKFQGIETYSLFHKHIVCFKAFPGDTMIKNLPPMQERQEVWIRFLSQEDPLGEGMAPHSRILAWEIPWMEEPGRLQSMRSQRVSYAWETEHTLIDTHTQTHTHIDTYTHRHTRLLF